MSYLTDFNRSSGNRPLTMDEIHQYAPSAFATEPHSSRSTRFAFIPTSNIIEGMIKAGFQPFSASQSRSRIQGKAEFTKHMIRFRYTAEAGPEVHALTLGDLRREVILVNAHDGTSTYKLMEGLFRCACLNGLFVATGTVDSISIMHKGNIIAEVIEGSHRIIENSQLALHAAQTWSQLQLTSGEQSAFADAAHSLRFADSEGKITTPITAAQLLRPRRSADAGSDLWKTFNVVQENVIKGGLHGVMRDDNGRRLRAVSTRQVKGIDQDVKLNRALWTLAEKMAELKGAASV